MTQPSAGDKLDAGDVEGAHELTFRGTRGSGFMFEAGGMLPEVTVAYETWGKLNRARDNAVLVLHALTGDSHAAGSADARHLSPGWWNGLIGPGAPVDTERFFVVCPNALGGCNGTTGPSSRDAAGLPYGSRFPKITIRDQVDIEVALADALNIDVWHGIIGGSMGGMRVLEWCIGFPERVARGVVLAVGAAATAEQIALCSLQMRAIEADPLFAGGDYYGSDRHPDVGLSLARGIGQVSYRTADELQTRFDRQRQGVAEPVDGGQFAVDSYLRYHGDKLVGRFDANSYLVLSRAMNVHDVGRGRGGIEPALGRATAEMTVAGINSDRLYPLSLQEELVRLLPRCHPLRLVSSLSGHDGFLLEVDQVGDVVSSALA